MPKFGWKCFVGSFVFSLAAVFAATKAYMSLAQKEKAAEDMAMAGIETKDIELFTQNEETDSVYEKALQIAGTSVITETPAELKPEDTLQPEQPTLALQEPTDAAVLYAPEENEDDFSTAADTSEIQTADNSDVADNILSPASLEENTALENELADNQPEPLVIADAATAQPFTIPLKHNFSVTATTVTVSSEAKTNQIALASASVATDNLGAENQPSVTEPLASQTQNDPYQEDSPWEVAEVSNAHITKNKLESFTSEHQDELSALDKNSNTAAHSENETQIAYKMMKNLLIPIPEDIMNDENLTPKLVYSEENKKLSEKMQQKNLLPKADEPKPTQEEKPESTDTPDVPEPMLIPENESQTSKSLTESIAAWFSNTDNKSSAADITPPQDTAGSEKTESKENTSAFGRLLNLGSSNKSNSIAPSELKLAFQPNRAEISGQTLEWLHAFSQNAIKHEDVFIEIRIGNSETAELQQKRLNLLYSILINNGVDFNKINIIFTAREPNSFIIRNVRYASEEDIAKAKRDSYNPWY